jgi:hypothetical protein
MKTLRQNVGKAGTQGTKPLPDGAGIAVRPFPIHLFNAAFDAPHDLGEILTPQQMAAKVPPSASPEAIDRAARKALDALAGCGPVQPVPHVYTAEALARGLAALRDFAIAGDAAAMRALGFVLSQAVADLAELARRKPKGVREWSRKQNVVPVLTGKNKGHRKQLVADLDAFDVGALSPYRVNPPKGRKTFDSSTTANYLASLLCAHLASYRFSVGIMQSHVPKWAKLASKLPPLSKAVWERWANAAWACLLDSTDGRPENNAGVAKLGAKGRAKHTQSLIKAAEKERLLRRAGIIPSAVRRHPSIDKKIRTAISEELGEVICKLASDQRPPVPL